MSFLNAASVSLYFSYFMYSVLDVVLSVSLYNSTAAQTIDLWGQKVILDS